MLDLALLVFSVSGGLFLLSVAALTFANAYEMVERRLPRDEKKEETLHVCSDGEARPYKAAVAFEEELISGEPPGTSWKGVVTRL